MSFTGHVPTPAHVALVHFGSYNAVRKGLGGDVMEMLLRYEGSSADQHELDFYDAARALSGFQRSLALTAHLVANGKIITKAPALRNVRLVISTPRPGSWETVVLIIGTFWTLGTASKDTPFGHMLYSVYDYVVRQTLGFPVDYSKSLYQLYEDTLQEKDITPARLDSLTEKIEASLADMHRPIVASRTAIKADIFAGSSANPKIRLGAELNSGSYDYIKQYVVDDDESNVEGLVSSYNVNTFSGRLYVYEENRTIPFEIENWVRTHANISAIASSLRANAVERGNRIGAIVMAGRRVLTSSGRLKGFRVSAVRQLD